MRKKSCLNYWTVVLSMISYIIISQFSDTLMTLIQPAVLERDRSLPCFLSAPEALFHYLPAAKT